MMKRRTFIKNVSLASGAMFMPPLFGSINSCEKSDFPLVDLHVHLTDKFTIDHVMEITEKTNVKFGIVDHPAVWALKDDADLKKHIDKLRKYPVYIGLQPTYLGWRKNYSAELISQLDYINGSTNGAYGKRRHMENLGIRHIY